MNGFRADKNIIAPQAEAKQMEEGDDVAMHACLDLPRLYLKQRRGFFPGVQYVRLQA